MGILNYPRPILLLGLWTFSAAGLAQTEPTPTAEPPARPIPLLFTRTVQARPLEKPTDNEAKDRILPLEVAVNGTKTGTWLLLERDGALYAPSDAFDAWRVQLPPGTQPIDFKLLGQPYWPLSAIPGYKFRLDYANQSADLLFSPEVFAATRLEQERSRRPVISPVLPSMFLNYDLNYSTSVLRNAPTVKDLGMLAEIGASNSLGVLTSSQAGRNLTDDPTSSNQQGWQPV